jgi:hypothetical protein|tara:strand:+ start:62 stop:370 length:309 start_codon:yes stop_codon:yes gene_type:complete
MRPVREEVVNNAPSKGRPSKIFSDENIKTMKENPNQWYELMSTTTPNYKSVTASYQSSARYFKDKLFRRQQLDIEWRTVQNYKEQTAIIYARVIGDTSNGTN